MILPPLVFPGSSHIRSHAVHANIAHSNETGWHTIKQSEINSKMFLRNDSKVFSICSRYQCDDFANLRVYKDDPDEETWELVAQTRDELQELIEQLQVLIS